MRACAVVLLVGAAVAIADAQAPIVNARVERRPVAQGLAREIQATIDRGTTTWIGYSVPIARRNDGTVRGTNWCCGRCRLEPPTELVVLARAEGRALVDVRSLSVDCDIDAGGMPLMWFETVNGDESVAWLASLVRDARPAPTRDRIASAALAAVALHAASAAAGPLVEFARDSGSTELRRRALLLLAQRAAAEAIPTITDAIDKDPDKETRRQAVVALGRMPADQALPRLMELARTHRDPDVRRQAMLSLGQSRDPRAIDFFSQILLK